MFIYDNLLKRYRASDAGEDTGGGDTTVPAGNEGTDTPASEDNGESDAPTPDADVADTPVAPENYEAFTMPEGVTVDETLLGEAAPLFKELNLTQEQAQKLVDFQAKQQAANAQGQTDSFNNLMSQWLEEAKSDKEIGGEKFDENIGIARQAIDKFGTSGLKDLLDSHGVGNHPEVIRFMVNVGRLTQEDVPDGNNAPVRSEADTLSTMYPND